jgi:23S rRNA (adenine2503-C2)-methyltransferase
MKTKEFSLAAETPMITELLGKSKEELGAFCVALGEPAFRGAQIYHALYAERKFDVAQITNLPKELRERLSKEARVALPKVKQRFASADGSVRYLFGLDDEEKHKRFNAEGTESAEFAEKNGEERVSRLQKSASVEAVFMPSEGRQTICISTQAGCAVDCHFCLTAQLGLIRNLTVGEILAQVLLPLEEAHRGTRIEMKDGGLPAGPGQVPPAATKQIEEKDGGLKAAATKSGLAPQTNIVLMGQGEPLLNFEPVMAAVRIMLDPEGMGISPKHVTLSTSGIVAGIERLAQEKVRPKLAISLNASNDEQRDALMPINKKYPLAVLMKACKEYPLRTWEHLTFEYVMLGGINDAAEDARRVVRLLAPLKSVKLNLIPWNPGELPYRESSAERIEEFRRILVDRGVPTFVRYSRGRDVMAACGQLALLQIGSSPLSVVSPQ